MANPASKIAVSAAAAVATSAAAVLVAKPNHAHPHSHPHWHKLMHERVLFEGVCVCRFSVQTDLLAAMQLHADDKQSCVRLC